MAPPTSRRLPCRHRSLSVADVERSHVDSHRERLFHTRACLKDMAGSCRALGSWHPVFPSRACCFSLSPSLSRASRVSSASCAPSLSVSPAPSRAPRHFLSHPLRLARLSTRARPSNRNFGPLTAGSTIIRTMGHCTDCSIVPPPPYARRQHPPCRPY